jgi:hypothetical protein
VAGRDTNNLRAKAHSGDTVDNPSLKDGVIKLILRHAIAHSITPAFRLGAKQVNRLRTLAHNITPAFRLGLSKRIEYGL